ncbi:hypothetical protein [Legionella rubrilucens]|nr:hypothetical protein [Legionella rubrilucens]
MIPSKKVLSIHSLNFVVIWLKNSQTTLSNQESWGQVALAEGTRQAIEGK